MRQVRNTSGEVISRWTRDQIAARVAVDIPNGAIVNLGIGLPTQVANHFSDDREVIIHSENGILGMGPAPLPGMEDPDLVNAGKEPVTISPGGAYFHQADSFSIMRGGHLDVCVLGAFEVSVKGDLANWHLGDSNSIPAVGGAMDLAIGAKQTYVMMSLFTKEGKCKIVRECQYPVTGVGCVKRVYTDLAVFDIRPDGLYVIDVVDDMSIDILEQLIEVPLMTEAL